MLSLRTLRAVLRTEKHFHQSSRNNHPFKISSYKSYELAEELCKNIVYNDNVVFNKPPGVSLGQNTELKEGLTFDAVRPHLLKSLNCQELFPAKVPERYASGVAIYCKNQLMLNRVQKCLRSMKGTRHLAEFYDCVVIGQPSTPEGNFEGGITVATPKDGRKQKGIKFVTEYSKIKVRNGEIKPVKLEHSTLSESEYASRLMISTTTRKLHSVRVYAATEIVSPILGDHVFGRFVRYVLRKPVLIDQFSPVAQQAQKLPPDLLSKLELSSRNDIEIPLHLHLCRVQLKNFLGKNEHLEFRAKPPDFFIWTCEVLHLNKVSIASAVN
ncbi:mitochondrial mRNA pseudouridine synthase RPUSD3 isoform X2 [Halyomorpha halys]|uniref:mitochondrial mRNA pseudouridine synthase RPUSD3 isoform X2 n=1 Tax=Halyomorpha halys TaxID=286706 RepID=UPI0034D28125